MDSSRSHENCVHKLNISWDTWYSGLGREKIEEFDYWRIIYTCSTFLKIYLVSFEWNNGLKYNNGLEYNNDLEHNTGLEHNNDLEYNNGLEYNDGLEYNNILEWNNSKDYKDSLQHNYSDKTLE